MKENIKFYSCEICGSIVGLIKNGGGHLACCGKAMDIIEPNTKEASLEKHIPVIERVDGKLKVSVGSTLHPMTEEHLIEWIAVATENSTQRISLGSGQEPVIYACDIDPEPGKTEVFAYCNLHGLWKATI